MSLINQTQRAAAQRSEDDESDEWVLVPDDIPRISPIWPGPGKRVVSSSLVELRFSIGRKTWGYSSHSIRTVPISTDVHANDHDKASSNVGPPQDQLQSPLFRLPHELRLYIYELVFMHLPPPKMIMRAAGNSRRCPPSVLALLETCRLVLQEAETIFYSINRLQLDRHPIPRTILDRRRESIKALDLVSTDAQTILSLLATLQHAPNVQSLSIVMPSKDLRFVNIDNWTLLVAQMDAALKKVGSLKEVKFVWQRCEPESATATDLERDRKFAQVARRLESVIETHA